MFRVVITAAAAARNCSISLLTKKISDIVPNCTPLALKTYHTLSVQNNLYTNLLRPTSSLLQNDKIKEISNNITRPLTKFSLNKGKRKSVKAVLKRFYRLDWGAWIRTKSGRHKKLWKKSPDRQRRLRQHVFTNATQSWMLDKMVTKYWRKPKYYVEDPYEPYHQREEFYITRKKPL